AGVVSLAEMADKTQLMTMVFVTKYKVSKVVIGILLAIILSQGLAVALGSIIGHNQSMNIWIQITASASFIFFGLWGLQEDKTEKVSSKNNKYGNILKVMIAFFIAELGDKTQLSTIAFSIKYPDYYMAVFLGSFTGMVIANALGVVIGVILCKHIPEGTIKIISAITFIAFGFIELYHIMIDMLFINVKIVIGILLLAAIIIISLLVYIVRNNNVIGKKSSKNKYCKVKQH
ncbi:MAG TPA: TMEM165/GDT1 family protein, partial [Clostridiaceae bacterium]|nr:TMEM165/GDT1 family protein [Clostridiaceae bacterium]